MAEISALDEAKRKRERELAAETVNDDDKESQSGGDSDPESLPSKKPKQTDEEPLSPRRRPSPKTISSVSRLRKNLSEMKTQDPSSSSTKIPNLHDSDLSSPSSSGDIQEESPPGDPIQEDPMQADNKRKERDMTPTTEAEVLNSSSPSKRRSWRPQSLGGSNGADHIAEQDVTMVEAKVPTSAISNPFLNPISPSYDPSWDIPVEDDVPVVTPKSPSMPLSKPIPTFGATSTFGTSSQGSFLQSSFQSSSESGFGGFGRTVVSEPTTTSSFATPSPFGALASSTSPFGALASSSSPFSVIAASSSSFLDEKDGGTEGFGSLLRKGKGNEKKAEEEEGDCDDDEDPDDEADDGEEGGGGGDGDGDGDGDSEVSREAVTGVFGSVRELPTGIEVSTGEEGEINLLQIKGKLYVMDHTAKQWKERGIGNLRLNTSDDRTQVRLVMRADAVLRVILNVLLKPDILTLSLEDKFVRFAAVENARATMFAFKVGQRDGARQLVRKINSALEEAEEARVLERIRQEPTSDESISDQANSAESGFGESKRDVQNRNEPFRDQSNSSASVPSEQNISQPKLNDHQPSAEFADTKAKS